MAITALTDLASLPDQSQDQDTFDANIAAMIRALPLRAQQENELAANLNSIAAGGAYAIPFAFAVTSSIGTAAGGKIACGDISNQAATTYFAIDLKDAKSSSVTSQLAQAAASTSTIKGTARLAKVGDTSKYIVLNITGWSTGTYHGLLAGTVVEASTTNPFSNADAVMLFLQRTGDKGDQGPLTPLQMIKVSDQKPQNTAPGPGTGGVSTGFWVTRDLNTVERNTITGASLSGNQVTLPAGSYRFRGRAPGYACGGHRVRLFNVTDNVMQAQGSNAVTTGPGASQPIQTDSTLSGFFTITASKTFALQHMAAPVNGSNGFTSPNGFGMNLGQTIEVYAELEFEKFA